MKCFMYFLINPGDSLSRPPHTPKKGSDKNADFSKQKFFLNKGGKVFKLF